jgi:hypothetical protein
MRKRLDCHMTDPAQFVPFIAAPVNKQDILEEGLTVSGQGLVYNFESAQYGSYKVGPTPVATSQQQASTHLLSQLFTRLPHHNAAQSVHTSASVLPAAHRVTAVTVSTHTALV